MESHLWSCKGSGPAWGAWKQPKQGQEPEAVSALHVGSGSQLGCFSGAPMPNASPLKEKTPKTTILLGEAVQLVAKIGGYLGRKNDQSPRHQILWQGYAAVHFMGMGLALLEDE